jgi:hypothetical protein
MFFKSIMTKSPWIEYFRTHQEKWIWNPYKEFQDSVASLPAMRKQEANKRREQLASKDRQHRTGKGKKSHHCKITGRWSGAGKGLYGVWYLVDNSVTVEKVRDNGRVHGEFYRKQPVTSRIYL